MGGGEQRETNSLGKVVKGDNGGMQRDDNSTVSTPPKCPLSHGLDEHMGSLAFDRMAEFLGRLSLHDD